MFVLSLLYIYICRIFMLRHKGNKENNRNFTTYYHIYIYKNTLGVYHAPKDFFEDLIV